MFVDGIVTGKLKKKLQILQLPKKNQPHFENSKNNINMEDKKDSKIEELPVNSNQENENKVAMLIDAKTDTLFQTVTCIISNPGETKTLKIKVLLDSGS